MNEWNIQARAHACQACGRGFEDREVYHTLLFDQKQAYERLDVCRACWEAQYGQGASDRKGFISHWKGVYEVPPPPPPDPIKRETAESLLRKLTGLNDPQHRPAAFILAVMLERKRVLKVKEQFTRQGQRVFLYEHPRTGDLFTIPDPNLQLDQVETVQRDVSLLLEHGLNPPGEAAAPAPAETGTGAVATQRASADSGVEQAPAGEVANGATLP